MNFFKDIIDLNNDIYNTQINNFKTNSVLRNILISFIVIFYFCGAFTLSKNPEYIKYISYKVNDPTIYGLVFFNFMHAGVIHLALNMIALFFLINRLFFIGTDRLISLIIWGMAGSLVFSSFFSSLNQVILGSSGFIFALFGFLVFYLIDLKIEYKSASNNFSRFIFINGTICLITSFIPNIAWYAHLGGFIFGGIYYLISRKNLDYSPINYLILVNKI